MSAFGQSKCYRVPDYCVCENCSKNTAKGTANKRRAYWVRDGNRHDLQVTGITKFIDPAQVLSSLGNPPPIRFMNRYSDRIPSFIVKAVHKHTLGVLFSGLSCALPLSVAV